MVYFQGVGTKGACGNSLSNQHLFSAMAVTVADEAYMTPSPSIFLNGGDAVSTGGEVTGFFPLFCHSPSCSPMAVSLVSVDLEPTASHPDLMSPEG